MEDGRAGTAYLVRVDGRPRLLIDTGPGSFLRFTEAGARTGSLDAIAISHLHVDHSGDLPAFLNAEGFQPPRAKPLMLVGPAAGGVHAGVDAFARALFGSGAGAWRHLGALVGQPVGGDADRAALAVREVEAGDPERGAATRIAVANQLVLTAIPVHHGGVPSLAFRVETGGATILFAGDQSLQSTGFESWASGTRPDMLVAHHVIPEGPGQPLGLHRRPDSIGVLAAAIAPARLVLSHHMARSLARLDEGLSAIGRHYKGPIAVASDGECYAIRP